MTVEALVRRDRVLAAAGLAGLALLAWLYLFRMEGMGGMEMAPAMPMPGDQGPWRFLLTFLMWAVMMVAMMVPAASPMILTFATINRRRAPATLRATPLVGAVLLIAAGIYQLTSLKYACLARCQSPLGFILSEWREGSRGALLMGLRHGAFCVGCCWALMALLFVAGVMNLLWVAAIAAFVFVEKLVPRGRAVSCSAGAALLAWGVWVLLRAL